jgi:multiple sugar transport system permease protein
VPAAHLVAYLTAPMIAVYYLGQRYLYEMDISGGSAGIK